MTLNNRNHAVLGLNEVDTPRARATLEISFEISTSSCGSDEINLDVAPNMSDATCSTEVNVDGSDDAATESGNDVNDDMSIDVIGMTSSMYIFIEEDRFRDLLENDVRMGMNECDCPIMRLCPKLKLVDAIARYAVAAAEYVRAIIVMFEVLS